MSKELELENQLGNSTNLSGKSNFDESKVEIEKDLFVISSDCPNGPSEFLDHGRNGILFKNNQKGELSKALQNYIFLREKKGMKLKLKQNAHKYTMFKHFQVLNKIITN